MALRTWRAETQNTWNLEGEEEMVEDGAGGVDRHQLLQGFVAHVKGLVFSRKIKKQSMQGIK